VTARPMDKPAATPSWRVSLAMTLAAWLVAFALVTTLLSVFGDQLAAPPLAVRALVISGVLVIVMTRLVLPPLSAAVRRWHARPQQQRAREAQRSRPTEGATPPREGRSPEAAPEESSAPQADAAA
jgi:antibiotic biosynthesis monooxygenase (ABM) superfamily enzyme